MRIFFTILLLLGLVILYDLITGSISIILAISGVVLGAGLGFIVGRMFAIRWHPKNNLVFAQMDAIGVILLAAYIIFSFFRNQLIGLLINGPQLPTMVFCIIAGTLLGRFISLGLGVSRVLRSEGLTKKR